LGILPSYDVPDLKILKFRIMYFNPVNNSLRQVTILDIENHKIISDTELDRDIRNVLKFDSGVNKNSFAGNPFLYHFQFKNLLKCARKDGKTFYDLWDEPLSREKLIVETEKRNRGGRTAAGNIYECFRINRGSVVMFKATTAKYLYSKYNAKNVLDPTAGWGGRLLGAWSLGINYTGIDTNINMVPAYDSMISKLKEYDRQSENSLFTFGDSPTQRMIWGNCLDIDFSKIEYDFVLTSPPYINLEIYEHMTPWESDEHFYKKFFIPLWEKCSSSIKPNGTIAFNISPKMYDDAILYGLRPSDGSEDLLQQMGAKHDSIKSGKKKQDKIYIWKM
jgi:hypothetical protein